MHTLTDAKQVQEWKDYVKEYDGNRKARNFSTEVPHVATHKDAKQKQYQFDTLMAQYRDPGQEQVAKVKEEAPLDFRRKQVKNMLDTKDQGFDIITLAERRVDLPPAEDKLTKKRILPKAQVAYNILTNGDHPEHHWKGSQRPEPKREYKKNVCMNVFRDFNIISNKYWEGHDQKETQETQVIKSQIEEKYKKTHDFNYIACSFYDKDKEDRAQEEIKLKQKEHGKEYLNRLPPTLRVRETVVFDASKDVPEEVKRFDEKKKNQKKRYEKRHQLEEEYRDIDVAAQDKAEELALNKYRNDKYFTEKLKGYDNITLEGTKDLVKNLESHGRTKPKPGLWDQIQHDAIERLPDRPGTLKDVAVENIVVQQVNVDKIPLYTRETQELNQSHPPHQEHQLGNWASVEHHHADLEANTSGGNFGVSNPHEYPQHSSNHADVQPQHYSSDHQENQPPKTSAMSNHSKPHAPPKLHNPELDKHTSLYRNPDAPAVPNSGGSLANGPAPMSRTHSSLSRSSKISFSSGKSRISNSALRLPTIHKPMEQGYHEPTGSQKSNTGVRIKSMGIESGGFQ